jgi:hypothetical protein
MGGLARARIWRRFLRQQYFKRIPAQYPAKAAATCPKICHKSFF